MSHLTVLLVVPLWPKLCSIAEVHSVCSCDAEFRVGRKKMTLSVTILGSGVVF